MGKKGFLPACALLLLLLLLSSPGAGAFAPENTRGVMTEECPLERDGQKIYGRLFLPEESDAPLPLILLSHGLGSDHRIMEPYAASFAENGFAAFVFDYIGGSEESMSDGSMSEMSVLTEAEDLSFILETFRSDSRFSADEIFLFGGSQGGFISAYAAGNHAGDRAGRACRGLTRDRRQ